jgi:hypothetical protein
MQPATVSSSRIDGVALPQIVEQVSNPHNRL